MGTFDYNKVKNPEYFKENRVEAHSDHKYYGSMEEMEQKQERLQLQHQQVDGHGHLQILISIQMEKKSYIQ